LRITSARLLLENCEQINNNFNYANEEMKYNCPQIWGESWQANIHMSAAMPGGNRNGDPGHQDEPADLSVGLVHWRASGGPDRPLLASQTGPDDHVVITGINPR
jgi:hypothetical protein